MSLNRGRKLKIILTAFVICGAFLFILPVNNAFAYHSTSTYDKPANGTLSANEWNNLLFDNSGGRGTDNLFGDFVNTWLPAKMNGPLGIATSSPADSGVMLDVNGYVRATGFIGPMSSFLSARSVSSGEFGFSTGGGNYTFGVTNPGNVGIGVPLPQYNLDVDGISRFNLSEYENSFLLYSSPDAARRFRVNNDAKNILLQEDGGLVGIGTSSPNALLDVNGLIKMRTGTIIASEDVINKGYLDSAIALATSSVITQVATSSFWQGSLTGNVWNANTGNIGIGTTNPLQKLFVNDGNIHINTPNNSSPGNGVRLNRPGATYAGFEIATNNTVDWSIGANSAGFGIYEDGQAATTRLIIKEGGNVGIGTTNPVGLLNVYSVASSSHALVVAPNGYVGIGKNNPAFRLDMQGDAYIQGSLYNWGNASIQTLSLGYGSAFPAILTTQTNDEDLTIDPSGVGRIIMQGNVGVGTTAPNDIFSIGNSGSAPAGSSNTGHNYTSTYLSSDNYALANYGLVKTLISAATSSSALWGGTTGGNIWSLNSANVGIGTTNPGRKLEVSGDWSGAAYWTPQLSLTGAADPLKAINMGIDTTNNVGRIQVARTGNAYYNLALQPYGGNVGVGTTTPTQKLDVFGNQALSGTLILNNPVGSQNGHNIKNLTIMSDPFYNSAIIGYDYDALVNADKKYTITFTGGFVGSNAALLFDGNTGSAISSTAGTTGSIEVNLGMMQHYFYGLALNSPWGTGYGFSSSFLIEKYYDPNSGNGWDSNCDNSEGDLVWAAISDVTGFAGSQYVTRTGLSNGICRIRVTFRDYTGSTSQIQIGDLSLYQFYYGYKGLSAKTTGDTIYGDYDFGDGTNRVHIDNSTGNSYFNGGRLGVGTTAPNDKFSIGSGGGISAPAGSSDTGHNYTSTYLSSDDYALANYGIVKTMIASATSTMPGLWGGTLGGAIWSLNTGYVGIGVSNPASKLDLAGDFRITPSGSSGGIFFAGANATRLYSDASTAGLWLINATSSRMFLGTGWNYDVQVGFDYTPGTTGAGAGRLAIGQTNKNAGTYTHGITSLYTNGLERMRINVDGNVGVGTTAPDAKLHLVTTGGGQFPFIAEITGVGANKFVVYPWTDGNTYLQHNGKVIFAPLSSVTGQLTIDTNGNIGVGTTTPLAKLHAVAADGTNNMGYNFIFDNQDVNAAHSNGLLVKGGADSNAAIIFAAQDYSGNNDFVIRGSGYVGVGITNPNDIFSIGNAGSAPAGSSNTGHNYTSTYLSSDDYALANYGVVKTLIASATSSAGLWMGVKNGNIWNGDAGAGNVGIGTTTPGAKLDIANNSLEKSLNISLTGSYSAVDSTYGVYVLNNRGGSQNNPSRYGGYFESQSYTSSSNYNYGVVGVANKIGGYGHTATGVLGIGRHTYTSYATVASSLIGVQGQVDFVDDSVALTNSTFGASFYANANIPTNKTLASYYGLYLNAPTGAGTITNKFGVYQADWSSRNYFAGNVGIGVSNPSNTLTAGLSSNSTSQSTSAVLNIFNSDTTANNMANIAFGQSGIGSNGFSRLGVIYTDRTGGSEDQDMFFGTIGGGAYSEKMRITSVGRVGIGTTNPLTELHIADSGQTYLTLQADTNNNETDTDAMLRYLIDGGTQKGVVGYDQGSDVMTLSYGADTNNHFNINSAGNIGVGITNPNDIFSIGNAGSAPAGSSNTGHNYTSTYLSSDDYALANYGIVKTLIASATSSAGLWMGVKNGNIWNGDAGAGNVGIGTTNPSAQLTIVPTSYTDSIVLKNIGNDEKRVAFGIDASNYGIARIFDNNQIEDIRLTTNGSSWFNGGNVGIGTTGPSGMLSITKSLTEGVSQEMISLSHDATWNLKLYQNFSVAGNMQYDWVQRYNGNNYNVMTFKAGNVGIGTTNPDALLRLTKNWDAPTDLRISNSNNHAAARSALLVGDAGSSFYLISYPSLGAVPLTGVFGTDSGLTGGMLFKTYNGNITFSPASTAAMTVAVGGNVGIGITNPNDIFSIGNAGSAPAGSSNTGHNYTSTYLSSDDYALANYGIVKTLIASATSSAGLWMGVKNGNIWNGDAGVGNVGIGTSSPIAKLHIVGQPNTYPLFVQYQSATEGIPAMPDYLTSVFIRNNSSAYANEVTYIGGSGAWTGLNFGDKDSYNIGSILYYNTDNSLRFGVNGSERMRIASNGNMGIGTSTPAAKLDVLGTVIVRNTTGIIMYDSAGLGGGRIYSSYNYANGEVDIRPLASTNPTVFSPNGGVIIGPQTSNPPANGLLVGGNVGIGITNPNDIFSIGNAGSAPAGSSNTGHNYTNTYLSSDDYALANYGIVKTLIASATSTMTGLWGGAVGGNIWSLNGSGNVGIGTTTPGALLDVVGTVRADSFVGPLNGSVIADNVTSGFFGNNYGGGTYTFGGWPSLLGGGSSINFYLASTGSHIIHAPQLYVRQDDSETSIIDTKVALDIHNDDGGQNTYSTLAFSSREAAGAGNSVALAGISGWKISAGTANAWSQGGLKLWVKDNGVLNEAIIINQAGNVGIGNTNPVNLLSVKRNSALTTAMVRIAEDGSGDSNLLFANNATGFLMGMDNSDSDKFKIANNGTDLSTNTLFTMTTSGNVGIGTTDPGVFKLKVAGDVAITGALLTQTGSDFAEEFKAPTALEPGTVVVMGDEGYKSVKACENSYDKTVVGIVSDNPSIIAGRTDIDNKNPEKVIVAMMGVVKVKVTNSNGQISKGDLLTTSDMKGFAMRAKNSKQGTVIGKALEDLNTKTGEIKVLVNLQ